MEIGYVLLEDKLNLLYKEVEKDIACLSRWMHSHGEDHPMTVVYKDIRDNKVELLKTMKEDKYE
tara:strand:- start:2711 stop:2902 length:192 start_codon:yes stop_codon:yes gene_type:complete